MPKVDMKRRKKIRYAKNKIIYKVIHEWIERIKN